ncbi:MAG: gfo/Idh/MocA family oxidoreductase [bacterium]|nr:gfo/Idh/MocA family oxidoreductase [bacterium]
MPSNRRHFLKTAAAGAGVLIHRKAFSANDTIRVGVTGLHGRGQDHVRGFAKQANVEVAALCDIDENVLREKRQSLDKEVRADAGLFTDFRDMLEKGDIDAVSIATPNHWHALQAIQACQAGKDVYVEKPCCHNLFEGQQLLKAARKYNRIVQHGTQSRSCPAFQEAIQLIHDGYLGEVYYAKGLCYKWRDTIGHTPNQANPPEGVHYDQWMGPAPKKPFSQNRFHYQWHWQWDYGNGDIGNQGVHEMDVTRWGLGVELPSQAYGMGGHFMFDDDQQTPNTMTAAFKYPNVNRMHQFEVRHWMTNDELDIGAKGNVIGCLFFGSEGYIKTWNYGEFQAYMGRERRPGKSAKSDTHHFENFIKAVRSQNRNDLNAEIVEGVRSCTLIHLANASYHVGRMLHFDPETQRVTNDDEANAFLFERKRGYRQPYDVPEEI